MSLSHSQFSTLHSPLSSIPPGYKQTEVGVIPEDWEVIAAAALVEPTAPICYGVVQVGHDTNGGVPIVAIKYVKEIASSPLHRTSALLERPYARSRVKGGDVLISIKGTIGRVGVVPEDFEGNISRELARLRLRPDYSAEYVAQQLEADGTQSRIAKSVVGTTRFEFSIATLRKFDLPVPTNRDEQRAIATALSDVDGLLGGLDRLIAKKRDLKQAAMQQLLTGQTRLPGFHGEWEVKRLENSMDCLDGVRVPLNEAQRAAMRGDYPYCGANGVLDYVSGYVIDDDIILMAEDGGYFDEYESRPIAYRMKGKCWINNHAHILKAKPGFDQGFMFYSLVHKNILPFLASGTRAKLNKSEMNKIEARLPKDQLEQTAIAEVLTEMDAELAALEQRREKSLALKQAMMQELLTGRIRLVESGKLKVESENSVKP